jgi:RNA polymerase sigma factor (sigma-70 family)
MYTEKIFIQSIEDNQKIIHKVCNLYMDNEQDKKDLFQEILLNAWKGFRNFKGDARFSTWLYRVALNTAITFYRKERRRIETIPLQEAAVTGDANPVADEAFRAMHQSIGELSGVDKALVMLYMDDYSYNEIADVMGITANHVAVKMARIKSKLKESAKKYL